MLGAARTDIVLKLASQLMLSLIIIQTYFCLYYVPFCYNGPFITQINIDIQIFVNGWYRIFHLEFKYDLLIRNIYDIP